MPRVSHPVWLFVWKNWLSPFLNNPSRLPRLFVRKGWEEERTERVEREKERIESVRKITQIRNKKERERENEE